MYVYEFVHMTYCWDDNDYDVAETEIFETYNDAAMYFEGKMDCVIREYLNEANVPDLKAFENSDDYCYYNLSNFSDKTEPSENIDDRYRWPCFYISIDEYGSETLRINKKKIMRFS